MQGNLLLKHEINPSTRTITLVYGGTSLTEVQKEEIRRRSSDFSLKDAGIDIQQGLSFDEFAARTSEVDKLKLEITRLSDLLKEKK